MQNSNEKNLNENNSNTKDTKYAKEVEAEAEAEMNPRVATNDTKLEAAARLRLNSIGWTG